MSSMSNPPAQAIRQAEREGAVVRPATGGQIESSVAGHSRDGASFPGLSRLELHRHSEGVPHAYAEKAGCNDYFSLRRSRRILYHDGSLYTATALPLHLSPVSGKSYPPRKIK